MRPALVLLIIVLLAVFIAPNVLSAVDDLAVQRQNSGSRAESNQALQERRPTRLRIPSAAAIRESRAKVNEVFGADAKKATSADAKIELAGRLLEQAAETSNEVDRYVLLTAAQELAVEVGDIDTADRAIRDIAAIYAVDGAQARLAMLEAAATKGPVGSSGKVIAAILAVVADLKTAKNLDSAEQLVQLALTAARRSKDRELQKLVSEELGDIRDRRKVGEKSQALVDRLAKNADDGEAASALGRLRCFVEDDWDAGLPLLARGADVQLSALAKAEIADPMTLAAQLQLADQWWDYAASQKGPEAAPAESRARMHYGLALGRLDGLEKARVMKRLETSASGGRAQSKRPKELVLWLDASVPGSLRGPDGRVFDPRQAREMTISEWVDSGGSRAVARQSKPIHLPSARAEAFGSKPGLVFGGKTFLVLPLKPPSAGTLVVVFNSHAKNTNMELIGTPENGPGLRIGIRDAGAVRAIVCRNSSTVEFFDTADGAIQPARTSVLVFAWPNPFAVRVNGRSFPAPKPARLNAAEGNALVVGAMNDGGAYPFIGDVAEIRCYSRILGPGELAAIEAELVGKWSGSR